MVPQGSNERDSNWFVNKPEKKLILERGVG